MPSLLARRRGDLAVARWRRHSSLSVSLDGVGRCGGGGGKRRRRRLRRARVGPLVQAQAVPRRRGNRRRRHLVLRPLRVRARHHAETHAQVSRNRMHGGPPMTPLSVLSQRVSRQLPSCSAQVPLPEAPRRGHKVGPVDLRDVSRRRTRCTPGYRRVWHFADYSPG